ncbi:MAG: hypothetical protein GC205_10735 [Bacteroidetes bacterium]|nr:hypothetical protein [Bacteroidota bacterium]
MFGTGKGAAFGQLRLVRRLVRPGFVCSITSITVLFFGFAGACFSQQSSTVPAAHPHGVQPTLPVALPQDAQPTLPAAQPQGLLPEPLPASLANPSPTIQGWLNALDWSTTDTAWVLVVEAPILGNCSLPKLAQLFAQAKGRPTATLLGGLRPAELSYWVQRQLPVPDKLGALLVDPAAWDSLQVLGQMRLYPFSRREVKLQHPAGTMNLRWGAMDSVQLDERLGPYSLLTTISNQGAHGLIALDPQYRRLRQVDPATGAVLRDLDLDIPYEAFYQRFVWPDTTGQSMLAWLDSDAFQARSLLHAESFRTAVLGDTLMLAFTRRYPKLVQDTSGRWVTTLQPQGFLLHLDSAWRILKQGLCHEVDLPPGFQFGGQALLPFGPDSGLVSLHDFRKGIPHRPNIGIYRMEEPGKVVVPKMLPLFIPEALQADSKGTRFAEPYLLGNAGHWIAGYRLHPTARIYPSGTSLHFPDTITARSNGLVSTMDRIAARRIAWVIVAEALDKEGRLWLIERRDSLPDRLLAFAHDGTGLIALPLPAALEGQPVHLEDGVLWGWKRRGDALWLLHTTFYTE